MFDPITRDEPVGVLGLGWMGSHFAGRLLRDGWRLIVFDVLPERRAALAEQGGRAAESAEAVVRECAAVLTSLPSSAVWEQVAGETLLPLAREGQVFVDLGTSRLERTREVAAALEARGAALVDAPVSGDPRTALYVFAGGDSEAFARVKPLLEVLSDPDHLTHGGPSGAGQILKGVNQLCMGLVRAAWLEAVSYGTRQGIEPGVIREAVGGPGGWRAELTSMARQVEEGGAEGHDLKFAELPHFLHAAEAAGIELPLTRALWEFCEPGPRDWRDNMNRPYVSFWHMLNRSGE
jgi:2-hydroxy-3-oxopropionate reductase